MRNIYLFLIMALSVSCNVDSLFDETAGGTGSQTGTENGSGITDDPKALRDFEFGMVVDGNNLFWRDSLTLVEASKELEDFVGDIEIDWGEIKAYMYERVEFGDGVKDMRLELKPADADVRSLSVVSSDPEVVKISAGKSYFDYRLEALSLGDATITVKVTAKSGVIEKKYIVKVKETLTMCLYMDEFWTNPSLNKIRYTLSRLPEGMPSVAIEIRDSLAIDAECRWRDVGKGVYEEQLNTITYELPAETLCRAYGEECCVLLRDFEDAMTHFSNNYVMGTEYVGDSDEVADMKYDYYPSHARLFIDVCMSDPYYDLNWFIRGNSVVTDDNDIKVKEFVDLENDKVAMEHFEISFLAGMDEEEISGTREKLQKILESIGVTLDEDDEIWDKLFTGMTEEEIQEFVDRIMKGEKDN